MAESWRASTDSEGGWTSIFAEHRRLIAHVFVGDNEPEDNLMMRANLIAAAPALLAACEKGRAWFKSETALEEISDVIKSFDEAIKAAKDGA